MEYIVCALSIILIVILYSNYKEKRMLKNTIKTQLNQIEKLNKKVKITEQERDDVKKQAVSYVNDIQQLTEKIKISENERDCYKKQNVSYAIEMQKLTQSLEEVQAKLDFYSNIEEASTNLNATQDVEAGQHLLEQATQQIKTARIHQESPESLYGNNEDRTETLLDNEQAFACAEMEHTRDNFFITGKAGTGKSFLLDVFRNTTEKSYLVLAPTGIAALNVRGLTLHSVFGYDNLEKLRVDMISAETLKIKSETHSTLQRVSTIIIDEISMVRVDILDKINRILKIINNNDLPFGGKQLLLFGDLFQLPPVVKSKEKEYLLDQYGGIHFFFANAYKTGNFRFFELTINHRQKDDAKYFSLLNRIREGKVTAEDIATLNTRITKDISIYDRFITLLPKKADVEYINQHRIAQLDSVGYTYEAKIVLDKYPDKKHNLETSFPIAQSLFLKKGALIMMVANDPEHRWVNGTLGIVNSLTNESISVAIDGRTYDIYPCDFTEQEITYKDGVIQYEDVLKIVQYPLVPAYAITVHKSQGQTFQNIVCDINQCFANGQAYVALSRCQSLNGLHLSKAISGSSIHVDKDVLNFYQSQTK